MKRKNQFTTEITQLYNTVILQNSRQQTANKSHIIKDGNHS